MLNSVKAFIRKAMGKRANRNLLSLDWINAVPIENVKPQSVKSIVFVIPPISKGAGGHTSILRIGTYLSSHGYDVVYAVDSTDFEEPQQIEQAKGCLSNYLGEIKSYKSIENNHYDIVIATDVMSVYYAQRLSGYKIIFVQDYEPLFFATGDYSYIAKQVYKMGFHLISLGEWNKQMILKHVDDSLSIDTIQFPYEKSEYTYLKRDYSQLKTQKKLSLCAYLRNTPRRMPGLCQLISKSLTEKFANDGIELSVFYYGETSLKYEYGKNLGKLNKKQLNQLYRDCDFGLVASGTNISLVPYEMMATGLPIIELKDGSFPYFFDDSDAFLFDLNYDSLYNEIKRAIANPEILVERDKKIQDKLKNLSWDKTAQEFKKIIENVVNNG
ncbi:MAG: glycosyltransferase family 1 protein [Clostridia bacterium]|nr:glycosyltransferase family 1 protein [Clostridia bacterium]